MYEAISGEDLGSTSRSMAVLGAVTVGFGSKISKAFTVFKKLMVSQRGVEAITNAEKIIDSAGKVGHLGADRIVKGLEKADTEESTNILAKVLSGAKRTTEKQMETVLDDGSKVLFRRDISEHAHDLGGKYRGTGPVDHYNIEIHVPKPDGGFSSKKNIHVLVDKDFNVIDVIK